MKNQTRTARPRLRNSAGQPRDETRREIRFFMPIFLLLSWNLSLVPRASPWPRQAKLLIYSDLTALTCLLSPGITFSESLAWSVSNAAELGQSHLSPTSLQTGAASQLPVNASFTELVSVLGSRRLLVYLPNRAQAPEAGTFGQRRFAK